MKKQLLFILLALLPMVANADAVEINGIYYNLVSKIKEAEVTHGTNEYKGTVNIPSSFTYNNIDYRVTSIGSYAFEGCRDLTSVAIPNSVTNIREYAFSHCRKLTSITIPNSVTSIVGSVFMNCSGLTSVTIPNSVTYIGGSAFEGCSGLTSITIPNSVTSIGGAAFIDCSGLTSVTIPNSVTSIGPSAFQRCSGLVSVTIPSSVTSIGDYALAECSSLTSIMISNSVTSIGDGAFYGCSGLTSVTIPNSVTFIGASAFQNCSELLDVYCFAKAVPKTGSNAFKDAYIEYATLHVPDASIDSYKTTVPWSGFKKIVGLSGTIPEEPTTPKCATPTISYKNGELTFCCNTEGAEFMSEITNTDIKKYYDAEVILDVTYQISVYATKTGYEDSDVATATLCWIDKEPSTDGITSIAQIRAKAIMIQNNGNVLTIQGADENTPISVYEINGTLAGTGICRDGTATVSTNLRPSSIAIVKIGDKSVKVMMK